MIAKVRVLLIAALALSVVSFAPFVPSASAATVAVFSGTITSGPDYDLHTLDLWEGAQIVATLVCDEIAPGDRPLDPVLRVYFPGSDPHDSAAYDLYNDDGYVAVPCNSFASSIVAFTAPVTGTYTFRADGFGSTTGPYTLTISGTTNEPQPGCDVLMPIPATAVGGTFVADAPVYWAPGNLTSPLVTIAAGNSARVLGLDASGQYYQIIWVCDFLWVPASTLGPNYDAVWNGAPLPAIVVDGDTK